MSMNSLTSLRSFTNEINKMTTRHNPEISPKQFNTAGTYKGIVYNNADPLRSGRLLIQVSGVLNTNLSSTPSGTYVWANPKSGNCFPGWGSYIIPPIGSTVYVEFEGGDPNKPLYSTGGWSTSSTIGDTITMSTDRSPANEDSEVFRLSEGASTFTGTSLAPPDAFFRCSINDLTPSIDVIHRTMKGSVIRMDEADERECIEIIDRGGNILKLASPVSMLDNTSNNSSRGASIDASNESGNESRMVDIKVQQLETYKDHNEKLDWFMLMKMMGGSTFRVLEGMDQHSILLKSSFVGLETMKDDPELGPEIMKNKMDKPGESKLLIQSLPGNIIQLTTKYGVISYDDQMMSLMIQTPPNDPNDPNEEKVFTSVVIESGKVTVNNSLVVEGDKVSINGTLEVSGEVHASNVITSKVDVNSHTHGGITPGDGKTKVPEESGSDPSPSTGSSGVLHKEYDDEKVDQDFNSRSVKEIIRPNDIWEGEDVGSSGADTSSIDSDGDNYYSQNKVVNEILDLSKG